MKRMLYLLVLLIPLALGGCDFFGSDKEGGSGNGDGGNGDGGDSTHLIVPLIVPSGGNHLA